jgi:hypothetical protein
VVNENGSFYSRILIRNKVYCTEEYGLKLKTRSYIVELKNGHIGCIVSVVYLETAGCFFVLRLYETEKDKRVNNVGVCISACNVKLCKKTDILIAVQSGDIIQKCILLKTFVLGQSTMCLFARQPNCVEKD